MQTDLPKPSETTPTGAIEADHRAKPARYAEAQRTSHRRHRRSPLRRLQKRIGKVVKWPVVLVVLLVLLIVPTALAVAFVTDANARVQDSWNGLKRVLSTLQSRSLSDLNQSDVSRLQASVDALTSDLVYDQQQTAFLRPLASLRPDIKNQLQILNASLELSQAAQATLTGLQPTFLLLLPSDTQQSTPTPQPGSVERLVELLRDGQGNFMAAAQSLTSAEAIFNALDVNSLSSDQYLTVQEVERYQQQFSDLNQILINSPDLLTTGFGLNAGQNYLILSQNSDEIRPSGGYISTFGWMRVNHAQIIDFGYAPTNPTSPSSPPDSFLSQLTIPSWWIQYQNPIYTAWDGSWYADFPSTAKMAAWFYDNGQNPRSPLDGVMGIDITGFEDLLGAIGNVTVPGYGDTVTADNFRQVIYKIREGSGDTPHKVFLAALYKQIFSDWQTLAQDKSSKLLGALLTALQQKHVMLYFKDSQLEQAVNALGWSGAQIPARNNDYVMVADTNLGNKSNSSVTRQLTYDVQIQPDGSLRSRLSIGFDYLASVAANDPAVNPRNYSDINYFNTMQVFVPAGAVLTDTKDLQAPVNTVSGTDNTDFVTLVEVNFDSTARYQFSYSTLPLVQSTGQYHHYRLLLQKQAGMAGESVEVSVTLPANATIVSASPDIAASYNLGQPVAVFRVQLVTDQWIDVVYTD